MLPVAIILVLHPPALLLVPAAVVALVVLVLLALLSGRGSRGGRRRGVFSLILGGLRLGLGQERVLVLLALLSVEEERVAVVDADAVLGLHDDKDLVRVL